MMKRHPVEQYFRNIVNSLVTIALGMAVTIKCFFVKPVTLQYPDEQPTIPEGYRGIHDYDVNRCIICLLCVRECPISCITLEAEGKGKQGKVLKYEIDYAKCLFCNLCCEVCPTSCIVMGKNYSLPGETREACVISFSVQRTEEPSATAPTGSATT
jgi:NADH-quinone oxidoreductase subunit I